jgi:uncharacterized membrane protein
MFWHEHMNTGGWVLMVLADIVMWGLIIAFVFWLAQDRRRREQHREMGAGPSARDILDRRLASGEINTDEYQRLRDALGHATPEQLPGIGQPEANT